MGPLRSSRSTRNLQYDNASSNARRQGGVIDHDPTEGLPVRKWEHQYITIKQNVKTEVEPTHGPNPDSPWPELPLPKDFHALAPHSQEMLRRARMGSRVKSNNSNDTRRAEDEPPADGDGKQDAIEEDRFITIRKWAPAKVQEKADVKYLADRRPGLPPLYGASAPTEVIMPAKKLVKVKTTDPITGLQRIYDTMILEGGEATVDGEIITEEEAAAALAAASAKETANTDSAVPIIVAEAPAPGTVVEGVGVVNEEGVVVAPSVTAAAAAVVEATPIRRRPPPPKRKKHGPGRGKKKIVVAPGQGVDVPASGLRNGEVATPATDGDAQTGTATEGATPMNLDGAGDEREGSNVQDEGDGNEYSGDEEGSEEGEIEDQGDDEAAPAHGPESTRNAQESAQTPPLPGVVAIKEETSTPNTAPSELIAPVAAPTSDVVMADSFPAVEAVQNPDPINSGEGVAAADPAASIVPEDHPIHEPSPGESEIQVPEVPSVVDVPAYEEPPAPEVIPEIEGASVPVLISTAADEATKPAEPTTDPIVEPESIAAPVAEVIQPATEELGPAPTSASAVEAQIPAPEVIMGNKSPTPPAPITVVPDVAIAGEPSEPAIELGSAINAEPVPSAAIEPAVQPVAPAASPPAASPPAPVEVDLLGSLEKTLDDE